MKTTLNNKHLIEEKYKNFSEPQFIKQVSSNLIRLLPNKTTYDRLVGVELGSIALVTLLSLETLKPSIFIRKSTKKYGTLKLIEGSFKENEKVIIIEDIIHSESQLEDTIEKLNTAKLIASEIITYKNFLGSNNYKSIPIKSLDE